MSDFFELQDKARLHTRVLVSYFILAVILIVAGVNLAVWLIVVWKLEMTLSYFQWFQIPYSWFTTGVVLVVILGASVRRISQLGKGGHSVAVMMKGRRIHSDTHDTEERILLNVVEEMSIASGVPMPGVYVMDHEQGLNAFAAGLKTSLAVIVVTQGLLKTLNRDELQGVIGHEFSHILNGDMKLNVNLIGILAGILAIGQLGGFILSSSFYTGHSRRGYSSGLSSHSSRNNRNGVQLPFVVMGLSLFIVGYLGLFFARLIKAGISRQREFLADASSVQFTRNKNGIIDALKKIQNHSRKGILRSAHVEDTNHMCFESSMSVTLNRLLGTHPPIDDRIKALSPWYRGSQIKETHHRSPEQVATASVMGFSSPSSSVGLEVDSGKKLVKNIGKIEQQNMDSALSIIQIIPEKIWSQCQSSISAARLMIFAILIHADGEQWKKLKISMKKKMPSNEFKILDDWVEQLLPLKGSIRLVLLNHILPQLKTIPESELKSFWKEILTLIKFNQKIKINEYIIYALLKLRLEKINFKSEIKNLKLVKSELAQLIAAFQLCSGQDAVTRQHQYQLLMKRLALGEIPSLSCEAFDAKMVHHSLIQLSRLTPLLKRPVIETLADSVIADGRIENNELELLRTVCDYMDCPMPVLGIKK